MTYKFYAVPGIESLAIVKSSARDWRVIERATADPEWPFTAAIGETSATLLEAVIQARVIAPERGYR